MARPPLLLLPALILLCAPIDRCTCPAPAHWLPVQPHRNHQATHQQLPPPFQPQQHLHRHPPHAHHRHAHHRGDSWPASTPPAAAATTDATTLLESTVIVPIYAASTAIATPINHNNLNNYNYNHNYNNNNNNNILSLSPAEQPMAPINNNDNEITNELLKLKHIRVNITRYVFDELYSKNITDSLSDANQLSDYSRDPLAGQPPGFGAAGSGSATSGAGLSAGPMGFVGGGGGGLEAGPTPNPRPYYGDFFYSMQTLYWPYHCVISLVICTLGIFANVTNIIVLTRSNMITAVNTILSAIAFSDLVVNISNIPYLTHELSDSTNSTSFQWALYLLFHAHTTVTAHTISIWLTCVLATWRYFVVCRSQSSNQRNWSVNLAKRAIGGVFLVVPVFCIPNYLSFAIIKDVSDGDLEYKVGFSELANESEFMQTFHFWIFSCLTKLVPCVLLSFFTTVLIRKLIRARDRRLRLTNYSSTQIKEADVCPITIPNGSRSHEGTSSDTGMVILNDIKTDNNKRENAIKSLNKQTSEISSFSCYDKNLTTSPETRSMVQTQNNSACQLDIDNIRTVTSSTSSFSDCEHSNLDHNPHRKQQTKLLSRLLVESAAGNTNNTTTVSTSALDANVLPPTDDVQKAQQSSTSRLVESLKTKQQTFGCSKSEMYMTIGAGPGSDNQRLVSIPKATSPPIGTNSPHPTKDQRRSQLSLKEPSKEAPQDYMSNSRERSIGSTTFAPFQLVKLQTAQRQLNQNETTTRLLIAVMIVFLICEIPAGILAALCGICGQDFFENVYQPFGILTDLLALINSLVNFILYCLMSTQFRITFYRVVLHCPAPNQPSYNNNLMENH